MEAFNQPPTILEAALRLHGICIASFGAASSHQIWLDVPQGDRSCSTRGRHKRINQQREESLK
jgi:hypothetical protein